MQGDLFLYLTPLSSYGEDRELARFANRSDVVVEYATKAVDADTVRSLVRKLSHPRYRALLLPDDFRRHTEMMEDVAVCARRMGLQVYPLTHFLKKHQLAAATAVPPTQQPAVAD